MDGNPRYPNINLSSRGIKGRPTSVIVAVTGALRKARVPEEEVKRFAIEALAGDFDHTLLTAVLWVNIKP